MTISAEMLEEIREYAIHMDWDVAFNGKSKGNQHLHRVNRIVTHLASRENGKIDISSAGGWLHDLGIVRGNRGHCFTGAELAEEYLTGLGTDTEDISQIKHCIEAHDGEIEAKTVEAMVVHDADTIDKMGPFGYIRHVWKMSLVEDLTAPQLVNIVGDHISKRETMLYFQASRGIAKDFCKTLQEFLSDEDAALKVTEIVVEQTPLGIPSEKVAEIIIDSSVVAKRFQDCVRSQIEIDYL